MAGKSPVNGHAFEVKVLNYQRILDANPSKKYEEIRSPIVAEGTRQNKVYPNMQSAVLAEYLIHI